jgi:hypothetical protein
MLCVLLTCVCVCVYVNEMCVCLLRYLTETTESPESGCLLRMSLTGRPGQFGRSGQFLFLWRETGQKFGQCFLFRRFLILEDTL